MNSDLKIIKKKYGEKFSKLCRDLFPSILENEGILSSLILSLFKENHFLYDDLIENNMVNKFQEFIMNEFNKNNEALSASAVRNGRCPPPGGRLDVRKTSYAP